MDILELQMLAMEKTVNNTLSSYGIEKNTPLIVACSGGMDSLVLAHILFHTGYTQCTLAYIHHGTRSDEEHEKDRFIVQSYANQFAYAYVTENITWQDKEFPSEERCREKRYALLNKLQKQHHSSWVVTGHHRDDQAETLLFRIIRGTGIYGLRGMNEGDVVHHRIRPMLSIGKEQIKQYAQYINMNWNEDSTNSNNAYKRNQIRNEIIPLLEQIHPNAIDHIAELAEKAKEVMGYADDELEALLGVEWKQDTQFMKKQIDELSHFLKKHFLRTMYKEHISAMYPCSQDHVEMMVSTLSSLSSGKKMEFGHGVGLLRIFDTYKVHYDHKILQDRKRKCWRLVQEEEEHASIHLPQSLVQQGIEVRFRKAGDQVLKYNKGIPYHSTLKKELLHLRVPVDLRNDIPVIAFTDNERIIALPFQNIYYLSEEEQQGPYLYFSLVL